MMLVQNIPDSEIEDAELLQNKTIQDERKEVLKTYLVSIAETKQIAVQVKADSAESARLIGLQEFLDGVYDGSIQNSSTEVNVALLNAKGDLENE